MTDATDYILNQCHLKLKKDMKVALAKLQHPQVFMTGFNSSGFKLDREAVKLGWYEELQYEYYSILYDAYDIEANYDYI